MCTHFIQSRSPSTNVFFLLPVPLHYLLTVPLRPATLLKRRLQHRCFPVYFVKYFRAHFFIERLRWLLLAKVNPLQLNLTQAGVEYLRLTDPSVIKKFKSFFSDMILNSLKPSKGLYEYKLIKRIFVSRSFPMTFSFIWFWFLCSGISLWEILPIFAWNSRYNSKLSNLSVTCRLLMPQPRNTLTCSEIFYLSIYNKIDTYRGSAYNVFNMWINNNVRALSVACARRVGFTMHKLKSE